MMKTKRPVSAGRILIVFLLTLVGVTSCSSDEDECCPYREIDGEVKEFINEKGYLHYSNDQGKWEFLPSSESIVFSIGDCEAMYITIANWDPSFEEYKDGCIVSGTFRQVGFRPHPPTMIGAGVHYFEMIISTISHIDPEN